MVRIFLLILTFFCVSKSPAADGRDYLSYLSNGSQWKKFVPDNFEIFQKKGEIAFYRLTDDKLEETAESSYLTQHPFILFKPNSVVEAQRKSKSGTSIYKTSYRIDASSRRIVGAQSADSDAKKNLVFLGCSFTFGSGVGDEENFPYYFSKNRSNFNTYNMGIPGAGANDILDDLRSFKRFADISKTGGLVVYTATDDHIERSTCDIGCYGKNYKDSVLKKSNYQYDAASQMLINKGSFENSRPMTTMIFNVLSKIGLIESLVVPLHFSDQQLELYVMMVEEMKKTAKEKLNSDFYYIMYPGYQKEWPRLKPLLKKYSIKYLDLSKMDFKKSTKNRQSIILDNHPTKLSHFLYANLIHHQLPK